VSGKWTASASAILLINGEHKVKAIYLSTAPSTVLTFVLPRIPWKANNNDSNVVTIQLSQDGGHTFSPLNPRELTYASTISLRVVPRP